MPAKQQIDELHKCVEVIIQSIKQHPDALSELDRLRIESLLTRLLNTVVATAKAKGVKS